MSSQGDEHCDTARADTRQKLPPSQHYLTSSARWCLARISWGSQLSWLSLYFTFNLLLTLSNKSVLTSFPFPYTLTAVHALCSTIGGLVMRSKGLYTVKQLDLRGELVLVAFSFLYSVNVAVSNVSLHQVTVPLHQIIRAITPLFIIGISAVLFGTRVSRDRLHALLPVIFGVALATYGDYYCTRWGFFLTLLGTFLAALKTIYTSALQARPKQHRSSQSTPRIPEPATWRSSTPGYFTKSRPTFLIVGYARRLLVPPSLDLHPLDLLTRMSPLAFVQCVIYAQVSGELDRLARLGITGPWLHAQDTFSSSILRNATLSPTASIDCVHDHDMYAVGGIPLSLALILLLNGCIAFGLNVVSFSANGKVGALSMTVAANVKQVLTILFSVFLFNLTITSTNALGITATLLGGAWYARVEYRGKHGKSKPPS
ncbi:hypothetical protein PHLGIDRAFT_66705 [Phlebiopsis gigantea 11061_1 CR5-6]|uniref:Sugar phosphate transporter domain-containing protein n=1 Tax=Phlebiopsis gigantea (strain 11061_1 CR5-6) TaxID=745531 RepID=A0A0C3SDU5_PHLG1|nr:hypothetical protein PHLGIDRAFT_66705 [Phlebiopsis gigantea 11061_1 CR5-6]